MGDHCDLLPLNMAPSYMPQGIISKRGTIVRDLIYLMVSLYLGGILLFNKWVNGRQIHVFQMNTITCYLFASESLRSNVYSPALHSFCFSDSVILLRRMSQLEDFWWLYQVFSCILLLETLFWSLNPPDQLLKLFWKLFDRFSYWISMCQLISDDLIMQIIKEGSCCVLYPILSMSFLPYNYSIILWPILIEFISCWWYLLIVHGTSSGDKKGN